LPLSSNSVILPHSLHLYSKTGTITSHQKKIGASGFEPPASWSRTKRSIQAELRPEN
jgi:hypothetical protein